MPACANDSNWPLMEKTGCGLLAIATGWNLGGGSWIYDAVTHELVGVRTYGDVAFGACRTFLYEAGDLTPCEEGSVCPLCQTDQACTPACSMEQLTRNGRGQPTYQLADGSLSNCDGLEASKRPELHLGCGRVTVVQQLGTFTFEAGTLAPLRALYPSDTECPGGWGEPTSACPDETVCSLCRGAPDVCTPQQLSGN